MTAKTLPARHKSTQHASRQTLKSLELLCFVMIRWLGQNVNHGGVRSAAGDALTIVAVPNMLSMHQPHDHKTD